MKCACSNDCIRSCGKEAKISVDDINKTKIALVGNPNVGKSAIFNKLSGFYVEVSNFPGTTVDISSAHTNFGEIIDTPGAYSISDYSDDELITQQVIKDVDAIVNVVSALSLERDLLLTQQLIDMDFPLILVINQTDEARLKGIEINFQQLEDELGIRVIPTVAVKSKGIKELKNSIINNDFKISSKKIPYIIKLFENNPDKEAIINELEKIEAKNSASLEIKETIIEERRQKIRDILDKTVSVGHSEISITDRLDNLLFNPISGTVFAIGLLLLLYQIIGVFVAADIVDFLSSNLDAKYNPWIIKTISELIPVKLLNSFLVGEFGILTMTVQVTVGVLLPLIIAFYMFMAILEDSGYLPRLAVLMDETLSKVGLNGKAIIPILLGFGCGTMGIITTRILGSKKERVIATAILGLTIPCTAQLGIIIALIAAIGGLKAWFLYLGCIGILMILTSTLLNKLIPGKADDLLIDIPPLRLPILANILSKTYFRVLHFLQEAVPLFILGSILVTGLHLTGSLQKLQNALAPVVVNLLHLPAEFANIFVMGLIRRDFASVGLLGMAGLEGHTGVLTPSQMLVSAVVVTLYVPCLAALIVVFKERGPKIAFAVLMGTLTVSIAMGAILSRILPFII